MVAPYQKKFIKNAIFLSYTALADYLRCPRAFYLKDIYRDPQLGYKIQIASPYLTLGGTVHSTIKWYLENPKKPTKEETLNKFRNFWRKYRLEKGGFSSLEEEIAFGKRGLKMLENFLDQADTLEPCAPFLQFPKFNLVENIVLHGNFDFVGECEDGSLHIVDFKTGTHEEQDPLQLYIYAILAEANFQKPVSKISYWYLDKDDGPKDVVLDPLDGKLEWLKQRGLEVKKAIEKNNWVCIKSPEVCRDCRDYQLILDGKGKFLFSDDAYKKQVYLLLANQAS